MQKYILSGYAVYRLGFERSTSTVEDTNITTPANFVFRMVTFMVILAVVAVMVTVTMFVDLPVVVKLRVLENAREVIGPK